jgi:ketosteroid isomerase-like protein
MTNLLLLCLWLVATTVNSFWSLHNIINKGSTAALFATQSVGGGESNLPTRANELVEALWGTSSGVINSNRIASACSEDIVWEDMRLKKPVTGKDAVYKLFQKQWPRGTTMSLDKVSDGAKSAGFTWTRVCKGKLGLRGTTYVKLNDEGRIECVKELAEPIYKPGDMMLKLLKASTKNVPRPEKNPTYEEETPTSCTEIVDYIWNRAYPNDADADEALRFYSQDIVYQDFNYPQPIVGLADVESFLREWGFPGIEFRVQDLSEGDVACCFTWRVKVNGQEGPQGISFYETDGKGKITYIRDTPAPTLRPIFGNLARLLRPNLRTFRSRKYMIDGIPTSYSKE